MRNEFVKEVGMHLKKGGHRKGEAEPCTNTYLPDLALSGRGRKKEPGIHCLHMCLISQKSWKLGIIGLDLCIHDIIINT